MSVCHGHVKWFSNVKGFGFLGHSDGPDVFVHFTAIDSEADQYKTLTEGDAVEWDIENGPSGKRQAVRVKLVK